MISFNYQNNNAGNDWVVIRHLTTTKTDKELIIMATLELPLTPEKINSVLKRCSSCKAEIPLIGFHKNKNRKDGYHNQCKRCRNNYTQKNKAEIAKYTKKYREINKEEISIKQKKYDMKNKKKISERMKRYCKNNKKKLAEYRENNKKKIAERMKIYHKENKKHFAEKKKEYDKTTQGRLSRAKRRHKRRAIKALAISEEFNPIDVLKRDRYICQACGCKTRPDYKNQYHPKRPELDHIIPLSRGGEHSMQNTQCLCHQCNIEKSNNHKNDQLLLFGY